MPELTMENFQQIVGEIDRRREELEAYTELAQGFARVWTRKANENGFTSYSCRASIDERKLVVVLHCSSNDGTMCDSSWDEAFPLSIIFQTEGEQLAAIEEYNKRALEKAREKTAKQTEDNIRAAVRLLKNEGVLPETFRAG